VTPDKSFSVAGDIGVGDYKPPASIPPSWPRVPADLLQRIRSLPGAASTASDVLDELGAATVLQDIVPRHAHGVVAGHVLTLAYLPERRALSHPELRRSPSRLAHHQVFALTQPGDVVIIDARGIESLSVFGGMAAIAAVKAGVAACIVDGGVRDIDEIRASGLRVWSRALTPRTGKWRLEATAINQPIMCGGVHVEPGDVVIADETGISLIPNDGAEKTLRRILQVSEEETRSRNPG
jgi:4-hydroxy-4-methyl-2-oxoglutarate aldolase